MYAEALSDVTGVYSQVGLFNGAMLLQREEMRRRRSAPMSGVFLFKNDMGQWEINESIQYNRPTACSVCLVATDDSEALTDVDTWIDDNGTPTEIKLSDCGKSGVPRGKSCQCDEVQQRLRNHQLTYLIE